MRTLMQLALVEDALGSSRLSVRRRAARRILKVRRWLESQARSTRDICFGARD